MSVSPAVIRWLTKKHGLSQKEIAYKLNVYPSEVSRIKAGNRKFTLTQLEKIAECHGLPLWRLLAAAENMDQADNQFVGDLNALRVLKLVAEEIRMRFGKLDEDNWNLDHQLDLGLRVRECQAVLKLVAKLEQDTGLVERPAAAPVPYMRRVGGEGSD